MTSRRRSRYANQRRYQRFFYQEAFRNLFTSIRFLNSDQPLRSIALTVRCQPKAIPGKRLLAKTLSEMGQRVLLIDADMRKPQMHVRLGLNNLSGLSNLLTEDEQTWRDAFRPCPDTTTGAYSPQDAVRQSCVCSAPTNALACDRTGAIRAIRSGALRHTTGVGSAMRPWLLKTAMA